MCNDANNNISYNNMNWASQIKNILDNIGLSNINQIDKSKN